jgi:polyisoprenoid-binding protein YceI
MPFQLDKSHSAVEFSARHMMISKVRGRFESFDVTVTLDEANPANTTVVATLDAASINTREAQRDAHLRSPDFLNADAHPQLVFKSSRVEQTGASTAKLHGDLTIRDMTRPVVVDVEFVGKSQSPWGQTAYGFEGNAKLNRKDWGLVWNVALETGGVLVSEEVQVHIELELIKVAEAEAVAAA